MNRKSEERYCLITRAEQDSLELAAELEHFNLKSFIEPLFDLHLLPGVNFKAALGVSDYCIITSKHALDAIIASGYETNGRVHQKFLVVGEQTAKLVRSYGFSVREDMISEDVETLISKIIESDIDRNKRIIYLRGEKVSKDIVMELKGSRFNIGEVVVYTAHYRNHLSRKLVNYFRDGHIMYVLLFSAETARTFREAIRYHELEESIGDVTTVSISKNVDKELTNLALSRRISAEKTLNSMIAELRELYEKEKI